MATIDPSQQVHADMLPHVHLLSTFRYALMPRVEVHEVTKWLMGAPKIARDQAAFFWTYLDCPQDGSVFLTWQPTARRNIEFASDGYIWPAPEVCYRNDVGNGLALEIYHHRHGYRPGEQFTAHSRRRFRLTPSMAQVPNMPQVDPNLWIVHYGPSDKNDRIPVNMMPIPAAIQHAMSVRQQLFQMGQIQRKEFMLADRVSWPQLHVPIRTGQAIYAPPMPTRNVPQGMAYPPHAAPPVGPTPKRRGGHGPGAAHPPPMMGAPFPSMDTMFDDEEDISRGDMFDHLTPQELSLYRYQQNHEWMEEILSSPYRIGQIEVADLGFGRKGELASLTEGIFEAQGSGNWEKGPKKPFTGRLDPALAAEFEKRVNERNDANAAETARLQGLISNIQQGFQETNTLRNTERELRLAAESMGSEFWRLEGRLEVTEDGQSRVNQHSEKNIDDILAQVEKVLDKKAVVIGDVTRVQEGGYQEPVPEPEPVQQPRTQAEVAMAGQSASMSRQVSQAGPQNSGVMIGDSDIDMGGTAAGLLDQMHTGFSSTSTPVNNFPTPQPHLSAIPSSAATPANLSVPSPLPAQPPTSQPAPAAEDTRMDDGGGATGSTTAPDQGTGSGEWVVVPKGGASPGSSSNQVAAAAPVNPPATLDGSAAQAVQTSKPPSAAPTPGDAMAFDGDNNDFSSLDDLNTAGDALAGYDPPSVDGAGGLGDLGMDLEDSAFGDAFHGVEQSGGNTPM